MEENEYEYLLFTYLMKVRTKSLKIVACQELKWSLWRKLKESKVGFHFTYLKSEKSELIQIAETEQYLHEYARKKRTQGKKRYLLFIINK